MATSTKERGPLIRTKIGIVTSDKRDQTLTVEVTFKVQHPKYGKYMKRRTRYNVHDPSNEAGKGDRVEIAHCRPVSKTKTWRLVSVLEKSPGED